MKSIIISIYILFSSIMCFAVSIHQPSIEDITVPGSDELSILDEPLMYDEYTSPSNGVLVKRVQTHTRRFQYNIVPAYHEIHCWQWIGLDTGRVNLTLDFDNGLLTGLDLNSSESTDGYLVFDNSQVKLAIHADGTMWVYVITPGKNVTFIPRINLDYDYGGAKYPTGWDSTDYLPDQRKVVQTNWIAIEDDEYDTKNINTTGGFGIYLRPTPAYKYYMEYRYDDVIPDYYSEFNLSTQYPYTTRSLNTVDSIGDNQTIRSQTSFIVTVFPTREKDNDMLNKRIVNLYPYKYDRDNPPDYRASNVDINTDYVFPTHDEVRSWSNDTWTPWADSNYANPEAGGTGFHYYVNTTPTPANVIVLFEDIWNYATQNAGYTMPGSSWIIDDTRHHAYMPYKAPDTEVSNEGKLQNFVDMMDNSFSNVDIILYVSALSDYCQIDYTLTEQQYFTYFFNEIDRLLSNYNDIDGFYIDTLPLDGDPNDKDKLEPMILSYRIMKEFKTNPDYQDLLIILHSTENPIGPKRIYTSEIHPNIPEPTCQEPPNLVQFDIYAPFIDRYADILLRGEAYPINVKVKWDPIHYKLVVKDEIADHIKYVVDPAGKSNTCGSLIWTRTASFSGDYSFFNREFACTNPASTISRNAAWYDFSYSTNNNEILANRLIVQDAVLDNYIKNGHIIFISSAPIYKQTGAPDLYQRRMLHAKPSYNDNVNPCLPGWLYRVCDGFGPNGDYYRSTGVAWRHSLNKYDSGSFPSINGLPYSTSFENGFDRHWRTRSSDSDYGRIQITSDYVPHTGSKHVTMDVSSNNHYNTNEALLNLDLSNETQVDLSFWWKDFGDENHSNDAIELNNDAIYFSDDGGTSFTRVYKLKPQSYTNNYWREFTIHVDELCVTAGLQLTNNFIIKFQQYDNCMISTDGFAFDDISVEPVTGIVPKKGPEQDIELLPKEFELSQNYPNPFNPSTTINYALPKNINVKIIIYNILGQKVRTLIDKYQFAGYKAVLWNGINDTGGKVSSGTYIYKIIAGNFVKSKKMILIK